tara:strand:- start:1345 stop:2001 length:657 start_codon:yes stop_codon:yes gene_type:complete
MTTLKVLKEYVGSDLGRPSKMPGFAWGISAKLCKTGGNLVKIKGSVCHKCYALRGNYLYESVVTSHNNRIAGYNRNNIKWRNAMIELIRKRIPQDSPEESKYFRIFDAGDIQSVQMLRDWIFIATQLPDIKFWLPTKEYRIIMAFNEPIPDNMVIRVSSPNIDQPPLTYAKFTHTSTVHSSMTEPVGFTCEAYTRGGKCDTCRACWDHEITNISYPKH